MGGPSEIDELTVAMNGKGKQVGIGELASLEQLHRPIILREGTMKGHDPVVPMRRHRNTGPGLGGAALPGVRAGGAAQAPATGDRAGQHSIRINNQFRLCFRWSASGPEDVEIVDDH